MGTLRKALYITFALALIIESTAKQPLKMIGLVILLLSGAGLLILSFTDKKNQY